jgi:hypothetical protein
MDIDKETYDQIAELIHSDDSPVGIDAKKTHIIIIHKLCQIEERLAAPRRRGAALGATPTLGASARLRDACPHHS